MKPLDLSKPKDCRWYLRNLNLRLANGQIRRPQSFTLENGKTVTVDQMTDVQAIQYANQLYEQLQLPSEKAGMN